MPWWAWLAGSLAVAGWLWRISFRVLAKDMANISGKLDGEDFAFALIFATMGFVVIGPFALLIGLIRRFTGEEAGLDGVARALGGESRGDKRKRRENELHKREEWIARKERELGIGQR